MADTIFYNLALKRGRRPMEVFEKMAKSVKKKGATKKWSYTIDEEREEFCIDFGDGLSESFVLHFENKVADGFCKVGFPLEGELFEDDKKSEFKILLNMIYSARSAFSSMDIQDDYGLAAEFMESKEFKIKLRELTEEEYARAGRMYDRGITSYPDFAIHLIYDYWGLPFEENYEKYVNPHVSCTYYDLQDEKYFLPLIESFLYQTSAYKDRGRIYLIPDYYTDLSGVYFSVYAFALMIEELNALVEDDFSKDISTWGFGVKHSQLIKYYKLKFLPALEQEKDSFERCVLIYRFVVSMYDFLGFQFVGRNPFFELIQQILGSWKRKTLYDLTDDWKANLNKKVKSFELLQNEQLLQGCVTYVTAGLSNIISGVPETCEVVMVLEEKDENFERMLVHDLIEIGNKGIPFKRMLREYDGNEGFETHGKKGIYYTDICKVPDCFSGLNVEGQKIYAAVFVSEEECDYIRQHGYEQFEQQMN